jgi:hypothetical protein
VLSTVTALRALNPLRSRDGSARCPFVRQPPGPDLQHRPIAESATDSNVTYWRSWEAERLRQRHASVRLRDDGGCGLKRFPPSGIVQLAAAQFPGAGPFGIRLHLIRRRRADALNGSTWDRVFRTVLGPLDFSPESAAIFARPCPGQRSPS